MREKSIKRVTTVAVTLCMLVCLLWVRSYWWSDLLGVNSTPPGGGMPTDGVIAVSPATLGHFTGLGSYAGSLYVTRFIAANPREPRTGWSGGRFSSPADVVYEYDQAHFAGFRVKWQDGGTSFVGVPFWLVLVACAWPAVARRLRAGRRPVPGHCPRCGYDVQATPDRCPECGWVAEGSAVT